jgi:TetR/AcrR family transcriptional regulator, mexJK operon transcriptional repressor
MEHRQNKRAQQTRERLRAAAQRLFLKQGYLATSIDAILAEAGISSKETIYRHYANKEELFVDVLGSLTLEQPGFSEKLSSLPAPRDLSSLRQALTQISREILSLMSQPEYLAMLRIIVSEAPRFPQLGSLFLSTVPLRGISMIMALLRVAREQQIITDVNFEAVARALLGGLVSYVLTNTLFAGDEARPLSPERADEVVEIIMRALTPQ